MKEIKIKEQRKLRRLNRTRKKLQKLKNRIRLSVFRSNKHFYAQLIDDSKGVTVASVSENELDQKTPMTKVEKASALAALLAKKAKEKNVSEVAFDKGSYRYHGRVKVFAEKARNEGLIF